jgi:hypothetical protein
VILHEAHRFPDVAAQFFGTRFGSCVVLSLVRDAELERVHVRMLRSDASGRAQLAELESAVGAISLSLTGLGDRIEWSRLPDSALEATEELAIALETVASRYDDPAIQELPCASAGGGPLRRRHACGRCWPMTNRWVCNGVDNAARYFSFEFDTIPVADR